MPNYQSVVNWMDPVFRLIIKCIHFWTTMADSSLHHLGSFISQDVVFRITLNDSMLKN